MARYIDADALSTYFDALAKHAGIEGLHNQAHLYRRCLQLVDDAPTADVVPKSEVERLKEQVSDLQDELYSETETSILTRNILL